MKSMLNRHAVRACCQWMLLLSLAMASICQAAAPKPTLTVPADAAPYSETSQSFSWAANGVEVSAYALTLGSSAGESDVHNSGMLAPDTLSETVNGIGTVPTLYIRLWHRDINGRWGYADSTAIATGGVNPPTIDSPERGSVFSADSQQLRWQDNGTNVTRYWLFAGSTRGGQEYLNRSVNRATGYTLTNLPTDGSTIYVRLWYFRNGWRYTDHRYTALNTSGSAPVSALPSLIEPEIDSLLTQSETTLRWQNNNFEPENYWIYAGTSLGSADIVSSGALGTANEYLLSDIPLDESIIYIRLWYTASNNNRNWDYTDYSFSSKLYGGPQITSPMPGATLSEEQQSFDWTANGEQVQSYQLLLGHGEGASDIYDSGTLDRNTLAATVESIPQTGQTLYLSLRYRIRGTWFEDHYRYQSLASHGFYEPFDADISRWSNVNGDWYNADGQRLATAVDDNWALAVYAGDTFSDFDYSARVRRLSASDQPVFLSIRGNGEAQDQDCWCAGTSCYSFEISNSQDYAVWSCTDSEWEPLVRPTHSAVINPGDAWNDLRVVAEGEALSFFINEQRVWQGRDSAHGSGLVGIGLVNHDENEQHTLEVEWAALTVINATQNLAAQGIATQSSTDFGGDAARAIDGDRDGDHFNNSVTHTGRQRQPWWQVDLGKQAELESLQIYNREDCCSERLRDVHVFSSATDMRYRRLAELLDDGSVSHQLITGVLDHATAVALSGTARYIRLQLDGRDYLSLAEIEVIGR